MPISRAISLLSVFARIVAILLPVGIILSSPSTAFPRSHKPKVQPITQYQEDYLKRARAMNPAVPQTVGSLWVATGPMATLVTDYKARNAGDLLVIHLVDNFTAATNGENKQNRQFAATSSVTNLLGKLNATGRLQNLLNGTSSSSLDGKGQSTMSSNVSMNLAAQILEVLPNGILVIQASRDLAVGNDRQTVILRGLVRPGDIANDNSISSNSIANLEVEIKGKGAVAEASRQPNILIRTLLKLFTF
jgi:flagellar L-ring protein precursor FlgH